MILSTFFYCKERLCVEAMDVEMTFFSLCARITKKKNFPVFEMTLLHFLAEIKETTVGGTTYGIMYNFLPKVIITL
jgi:hypothetical protein